MPATLVWLKRDLRTADHAPLAALLADGTVLVKDIYAGGSSYPSTLTNVNKLTVTEWAASLGMSKQAGYQAYDKFFYRIIKLRQYVVQVFYIVGKNSARYQ